MSVNYEYYRCFYYAAKYRNLTQAAAAMQTSQPNVTRIIRNLEQQLDCRLMIRSNRGIALTPEGERLYRHAAAAFEELQLGEEELTRSGGLESGSVRIGASEAALHGLLLSVLRQFHQEYPGVRIQIRNDTALKVLNDLRQGQIDFAVVTMPEGPVPKPLRRTDLKPLRDILVGGPQFAHLAGRPLHLAELADYPMICLSRDTSTFGFYSRVFRQHGLEFDPDMEAATTDLLLPMVENDLGLGFVPYEFAEEALRTGRVVQLTLEESIPERSICLVQDVPSGISPAARVLRQMLMSCRLE